MNRATKRLLAKQEAAAEREKARAARIAPAAGRGAPSDAKRQERKDPRRKRMWRFLKEVRLELKKVAWPTRSEVVTYTIVVLVSVGVVTAYVFGLDFLFGRTILEVFKTG